MDHHLTASLSPLGREVLLFHACLSCCQTFLTVAGATSEDRGSGTSVTLWEKQGHTELCHKDTWAMSLGWDGRRTSLTSQLRPTVLHPE